MSIANGALLSPLILLKESLARLPRERLHLFQRTVTLRLRQQTAGQDQTQQRHTAHIELQKEKKANTKLKSNSKFGFKIIRIFIAYVLRVSEGE